MDANSLIAILDEESDTRVASVDAEGNVRLDSPNGQLREQLQAVEFPYVNRFLRDGRGIVHVVALTWSTNEGSFDSALVVSERYPFLHDRTLSSIVLESNANSCVHKRLEWIWGATRGEIYIDLVPYENGSRCARVTEAWMMLGNAQVEMNEVSYGDTACSSTYAWAYATPLGSLTFSQENLSFTIEGLGSSGQGSGDCVVGRR